MGTGQSKKSASTSIGSQRRSSQNPSAADSNSAMQQAITGKVTLAGVVDDDVNVTIREIEGAPASSLDPGTPVLSKVAGAGYGRVDRTIAGGVKAIFDDLSLIPDEATRQLQGQPEVTLHPGGVPTRQAPEGANTAAEDIESVPITGDFIREMDEYSKRKQADRDAEMQAEQDAHNEGRAGDDAAEAEALWREQQAHDERMKDKVH